MFDRVIKIIESVKPGFDSESNSRLWLNIESFYFNPNDYTIVVDASKEPYELSEIGYKVGKFIKDKLKIEEIELPSVTDFNFLLGLLQSQINIKESVNWEDASVLFREPEEYVSFKLIGEPIIKIPYLDIELKLEDILFLNKIITDLKYFINRPHNDYELSRLVKDVKYYIEEYTQIHTILHDGSKKIYPSVTRQLFPLMCEVSKASNNEFYVLHATYRPENPVRKVGLVGKGIHFDTGGYSLKPSDSMITMKKDKTGAITAMMYFILAAYFKAPIEIDLVLGFTENMINTDGYKPGDVIKSHNGKTIEIINTDAEGRLLLADCLEYLDRMDKEFDYIVTIATLTGAAMRSFSNYIIPLHLPIDKTSNINITALSTGDVIELVRPHPKLKDTLKSKIADIRNVASTDQAGNITAYMFLQEFTKYDLLHYDIVGPSYTDKQFKYTEFGATGCLLDVFFVECLKLNKLADIEKYEEDDIDYI